MPAHRRTSRTSQPVSINGYIADLAQQGNLPALSELMETTRLAWMSAWEQSPQRTIPLDSEVLHALADLPREKQETMLALLAVIFTNGSIHYKRKGRTW